MWGASGLVRTFPNTSLVPQSLPVLVMLRSPYTHKVPPHTAYKRLPPAAYSPACPVKTPSLGVRFF